MRSAFPLSLISFRLVFLCVISLFFLIFHRRCFVAIGCELLMLISVSNVHRNVIYFWAGSKLYGKNNPEPVNGRIVNKKKNKSVEECTRCTLHALFHYVSILSLQYKQHKRRFYGIMRFGCELKMRCILSHFPRLWQSQMSTNQMTVEMGNSFTNFMPRHMHISLPFSPHISLSLTRC